MHRVASSILFLHTCNHHERKLLASGHVIRILHEAGLGSLSIAYPLTAWRRKKQTLQLAHPSIILGHNQGFGSRSDSGGSYEQLKREVKLGGLSTPMVIDLSSEAAVLLPTLESSLRCVLISNYRPATGNYLGSQPTTGGRAHTSEKAD
jgi:hypothetical protein